MEPINVKKRLGFLVYFLVFFLMTFSDAAIWNDGTHFLYQLINKGLFIDHIWYRYSDILFQLPALLSLKLFGLNSFLVWIFKATLYALPLSIILFTPLLETKKAKSFIYAVFFLILPAGLMFPISTMNLSIAFGAIILALSFENKLNIPRILLFIFSHAIVFYGHELGIFINILLVFVLMSYWTRGKQKKYTKLFFIFELIFTVLFITTKYKLFNLNQNYVSELAQINKSASFFIFPIIILAGLSFLKTKEMQEAKYIKSLAGMVLFFFVISLYTMDGHEFYQFASAFRLTIVFFALLLFIIFEFNTHIMITNSFIKFSIVITLLICTKATLIWNDFSFPSQNFSGCKILDTSKYKWAPPNWTIPMYAIIKQYSFQPEYTWVPSSQLKSKECLKFGDHLVLTKDERYHIIPFYWKIDGKKILKEVSQAYFTIPYTDPNYKLLLPHRGQILFHNTNKEKPILNQCLDIEFIKLTKHITTFKIELDGQKFKEGTIKQSAKFSFPISQAFERLKLITITDETKSVNLKKLSLNSCQI